MTRIPDPAIRALHLLVLSAFALAQPLFELIARQGEFLIAHRATRGDVALIAAATSWVVPGLVILAKAAIERLFPSCAVRLHLGVTAILACAIALPPLKSLFPLDGVGDPTGGAVLLPLAALLATAATVAYARWARVRAFVTVLAPAVLIFPGVFFWNALPGVAGGREPAPGTGFDPKIESNIDVVFVVFDALPLTSLLDESGGIDASRHPAFAALAQQSHWYRNATTVSEETTFAVPAILTGAYTKWKRLALFRNYPRNLFTLLAPSHDLNVIEPMTQLCPATLCASGRRETRSVRLAALGSDLAFLTLHLLVPDDWLETLPPVTSTWRDFAGRGSGKNQRGGDSDARDVESTVMAFEERALGLRNPRPALHFLHLDLPHGPYTLLPSGKSYGGRGILRRGDRNLPGDLEWATAQALQRHLFQLAYADALLGRLRRRFEAADLWDRSLVVVTADHGRSFLPGSSPRRISHENDGVGDILGIPLFVKLPGQREGLVSDRNVETIDILPTVLDALGGTAPRELDGHSLLDPSAPERSHKIVHAPHRSPEGRRKPLRNQFVFDAARLPISDTVRRIYELFDFDAGRDALFRFGPHRELIGKRGDASGAAAAQVELDDPSRYDEFDPDSGFVPAHVSGSLSGPDATGPPLDLAIAVNGTIRAVTRSHGHANPPIRFEAMLPEGAFRKGANRVEVFLVAESPEGISLRATE
ncbi:MAG: sulfatase-like hydrolase/transferase [Myxococcota bacterium]